MNALDMNESHTYLGFTFHSLLVPVMVRNTEGSVWLHVLPDRLTASAANTDVYIEWWWYECAYALLRVIKQQVPTCLQTTVMFSYRDVLLLIMSLCFSLRSLCITGISWLGRTGHSVTWYMSNTWISAYSASFSSYEKSGELVYQYCTRIWSWCRGRLYWQMECSA